MRIQWRYLILALFLFIVEVLIATQFSGRSFIRGSLGDYLVVMLVYCGVKVLWQPPPMPLGIGVFVFAGLVELAQFFHLADLLGFPKRSIGHIVLGNSFSLEDILMYGLGTLTVVWLDKRWMAWRESRA